MQPHIRNYINEYGADPMCESCGAVAVDIHHIVPRSKFGSKRKDEQDAVSNLVALCRMCHDKAHANREFNNGLKIIASKR